MTDASPTRTLPRLGRHLLFWFAGCAAVMIWAYTQLLDFYFDRGIELKTESFLERTASEYANARKRNRSTPLPSGPSLTAYLDLADLPPSIRTAFDLSEVEHRVVLRHLNTNFFDDDDDDDVLSVDSLDLCPEGRCDLIFLYGYRMSRDQWLYLVHGVVATDDVYRELELSDQGAFAIAALFTLLLLVVSFLVIRSVYRPLRELERWSAGLSSEVATPTIPDLRFQEFDALAKRLQDAFDRIRAGVEKEKQFLRHASHELRTPIAILAANTELLDRLSERRERPDAETEALQRQYRALDDVTQLIETLLWVNRQTETIPEREQVNLRDIVDTIAEQQKHLLIEGVELEITGSEARILAPLSAVRIVLSNVVRNALQYTPEGHIRIEIEPMAVRVQNTSGGTAEEPGTEVDYGYGLGLELVALICSRLGWSFESAQTPDGWTTRIRFEG